MPEDTQALPELFTSRLELEDGNHLDLVEEDPEAYAMQGQLWKEDQHPRDGDGKFADKETDKNRTSEETTPKNTGSAPDKKRTPPPKNPLNQLDLPILNELTQGEADPGMGSTRRATKLLDFEDYDHFLVQYSGGKDSTASLLELIDRLKDQGWSQEKIRDRVELWHQKVDGENRRFMDWPVTEGYCRKVAQALGLRIRMQWRDAGFEGELTKKDTPTAGTWFEDDEGNRTFLEPEGSPQTRELWPMKTKDLRRRWCSSTLKIDVANRTITNDPRIRKNKQLLFISGERHEEGGARAAYLESELHGKNVKSRLVHHWRPIVEWDEQKVWDKMREHGVVPHPAYRIGYNRLSCQH